ncbi:MAG TPA: SWIM zinc finger family protein, partial [Acidimicrobiales bacterium]|nr:SWIM zinc finger family protein [Acidimicrobiales bacterium]
MNVTAGIEVITDDVLAELYDPGSHRRGRAYADEARVKLMRTQPGNLTSVVAGSENHTYLVRVDWGMRGTSVVVSDQCSCPLGGDCKHAVATILTARAASHEPPASARVPDWRGALSGIVDG